MFGNPENAKIYLNNAYKGKTPYTIKGLRSGNYQITLKKDGYKDWQQSQYVREGQEANINGQLIYPRQSRGLSPGIPFRGLLRVP